jgi:HAMP domain-containing protein/HPt (histidine-containing phosphotransfer) domain-containing protein
VIPAAEPEPSAASQVRAAEPRPESAGPAPGSELSSGVVAIDPARSTSSMAAPRRWSLSIAQKLGLLMFSLVLAIVVPLTMYFEHRQVSTLRDRLASKADTYAQLLSSQVRSAVAFDDRETAREAFQALASDTDLSGVVLFTARGIVLENWGSLSDLAQQGRTGVTERRVYQLPDRVLALAPVVSAEGPRGTLALELSKADLERGRSEVQRTSLLMGGSALLVGVVLALAIAHSFARRLRAIARVAGLVAAGDLSQSAVRDGSGDEIGSLSRSFGVMLEQLKRLIAEIKTRAEQEQARLEGLVEQRTRALARRNGDMRRVLDNVDQGFLSIDRQGCMSEERSRIIERWLGEPPTTGCLWDYVEQSATGMGILFQLGWEQVTDGLLPLDAALETMPRGFVLGSSHFAIEYKPILNDAGEFESMLVVLSDITAQVERERLEEEERGVLQLFSRVLADRSGVLEFLAEANALVEQLTQRTPGEIELTKRLLHTLKGNTALFGLEGIAKVCHSIEDNLQESGGNLTPADAERLASKWQALTGKLGRFLDAPEQNSVTIDDEEYQEILAALSSAQPHRQIAAMVEAWRLEPVGVRLTRLAKQAEGLATRLQKAPVDVRIEGSRLRLDSDQLADVWSNLPHLLRNALDHGIETPSERAAAGKQEPARLVLRASLSAQSFSIDVEDSGRGIDWDALREAARRRGVSCSTQRELCDALFADGVSTRSDVTLDSGRGVGTAALARAVRASGGRIEVTSERGKGARFRLSWPASIARAPLLSGIPGGRSSLGQKRDGIRA